jgi:hypothetical protein
MASSRIERRDRRRLFLNAAMSDAFMEPELLPGVVPMRHGVSNDSTTATLRTRCGELE